MQGGLVAWALVPLRLSVMAVRMEGGDKALRQSLACRRWQVASLVNVAGRVMMRALLHFAVRPINQARAGSLEKTVERGHRC